MTHTYTLVKHLGYIRNKEIRQSTGSHFNTQGHSQDDMKFTVLEQSKRANIVYRKEKRELLDKIIQLIL